jgi:hypothetical protein
MNELTSMIVTTVVTEVFKILSGRPGENDLPRPVPVALRCHGGQFLCADQNKGGLVTADRNECREWEVFLMRQRGRGKVNLLAFDGSYVCADRNRGGLLVADRTSTWVWSPLSWELFTLEYHDHRIALRSSSGDYVCAEGGGGGGVIADRDRVGAWELFELIQLQSLMDR